MVTKDIAALTKPAPSVSNVRAQPLESQLRLVSPPLSLQWLAAAAVCGAIAGCSAPGLDAGWLAWIAFAPLFWVCSQREKPLDAAILGTIYGAGFNLVYLQWYLQVRDSAWSAVFALSPGASRIVVWLAMALLQGLFIGAACYLLRRLPLCAGFLPQKGKLPLYLVAPILWVVLIEKIANFRGLLGVPWSMLEYTQYNHPAIIQIASVIGGSGLACAIILANIVLATIAATMLKSCAWAFDSRRAAVGNITVAIALLLAIPLFGHARLSAAQFNAPHVKVSALQTNLAPTTHGVSATQAIERGLQLAITSRAEICVWPEWAVPIDWSAQQNFLRFFAHEAQLNKQTWIMGVFDRAGTPGGREYNSIGVVRADGTIEAKPYHKQFLVPFGEYVPDWVYCTPLMALFDPQHQVPHGMLSGSESIVLNAGKAKVGPMICFENSLPEFAASSVRGGAQLLVDCSNTTWFNYSNVLGRQLIAFSVLRAVENHRAFVFSTVLGPSAIIDPNGRILQQAHIDQPIALEADVPLESDTTPFTRLCRF